MANRQIPDNIVMCGSDKRYTKSDAICSLHDIPYIVPLLHRLQAKFMGLQTLWTQAWRPYAFAWFGTQAI